MPASDGFLLRGEGDKVFVGLGVVGGFEMLAQRVAADGDALFNDDLGFA